MDWEVLFATLQADALEAAPVVIPIGIAVFGTFAALGIAMRFLRKAGVK